MKFKIVTLFPEMFKGPLNESILKRAQDKGSISIEYINLRDYGLGERKTVDDTPYGGGVGMVLRVDVMAKAIEAAKKGMKKYRVILLTPQGNPYNQDTAKKLAGTNEDMILVCGHYEGFDDRIRQLVDMEVSIGEYILTGGEIAAMVVIDTIARLIPGVLGTDESVKEESFNKKQYIEYPQYTRPETWQDKKVPEILLTGDHQKIREWRQLEAEKRSKKYQSK